MNLRVTAPVLSQVQLPSLNKPIKRTELKEESRKRRFILAKKFC